ncbi:MAG: DUF222 domain-containing protein, partial [Actinobacteria bacterium]|nr:DUF222 domain-containing protein [Actinomycetota bacterium]
MAGGDARFHDREHRVVHQGAGGGAGGGLWSLDARGRQVAGAHLRPQDGDDGGSGGCRHGHGAQVGRAARYQAGRRRGQVVRQQTEAIASAATADPGSEQKLLEAAPKLSLKELRDEADRVKAAADRDAEARRKRIHRERSLRSWTDAQGAGNLLWRDNPERVAQVMAVLQGVADKKFEEARKEERHESPGAYLADALVDVACGGSEGESASRSTGTRRPGPPKVIVRVDLDALLRGVVEEGETCELVGYGPIAVSAVEEMIASGAIVCAVGTKACDLVTVVHLKRRPTAVMETALQWLYPTCAVEGCGQVGRLQRDHRDDWSKTKQTFFLGLDLLCPSTTGSRRRRTGSWCGARASGHSWRPMTPAIPNTPTPRPTPPDGGDHVLRPGRGRALGAREYAAARVQVDA